MIIAIGSTNPIKVNAVKEVLLDYALFNNVEVLSIEADSNVSDQPLSLEEIIQGAKNRAKQAFDQSKASYSFGIESGLMEAKGTQSGFLETCICCIYDGQTYSIGMSCGYEIPPEILSIVIDQKKNLGQACFESGVTSNKKLGASEGLVGLVTKGRINRKEYTKQCIITALAQIENVALYQSSNSTVSH
jgi:inosine/xanthosine triphosphatase